MPDLIVDTFAKINLTLYVAGRRDDGYHELSSVMHEIPLCDTMTFTRTDSGIALESDCKAIPLDSSNIAYKAACAFYEHTGINSGVRIGIRKRIPVAAGLAGGSGNAAGTLRALNEFYDAGLSGGELRDMGRCLGADVPFMLTGGAALCTGIGDVIERLPRLSGCALLLVYPGVSLSTRDIFAAYDAQTAAPPANAAKREAVAAGLRTGDITAVAAGLHNDLQPAAERVCPVIGELCARLRVLGALGACMSGSGPTVFALFGDERTAQSALEACRTRLPRAFDVAHGCFASVFAL